MESNTEAGTVETGEIPHLFGGKGAEASDNSQKRPLRCLHRWALVSRSGIKDKVTSKGTLFIQSCRRCGTFRASSFWPHEEKGRIELIWRVQYLKAEEGRHTAIFDPGSHE
jgi:hypothetical protein